MTIRIHHVLLSSLLGSAAFVPGAMAQEQQPAGQQPQSGETAAVAECQELEQISEENADRFQQVWLDEAQGAIEEGNAERCVLFVESAENALGQAEGGAGTEEGGRLVLDIPEPQVTVTQDAPEVTVTQPDPQVTVDQAQPEIIVRQAQPTVTIQMPQPTVTIDQPQPEIIVRMPEPEVQVSQADPEVAVDQAQPEVAIEQGQPQVEVERQQEAEVQVDQGQPVVQLEQSEAEAEVAVEQAQPNVSFEAAEPNVQVESGGEPQVEFTQSGEPQIRFEEQGEAGQQQAAAEAPAADAPAAEEQETAQAETTPQPRAEATGEEAAMTDDWRAGREPLSAPEIEREGYTAAEATSVEADQIQGAQVYGTDDGEIASVDDVVVGPDGSIEYFLMDVGGFLGVGSRQVAVGLDEVTVLTNEAGDDTRVYVGASQQELEALPEYQGD